MELVIGNPSDTIPVNMTVFLVLKNLKKKIEEKNERKVVFIRF